MQHAPYRRDSPWFAGMGARGQTTMQPKRLIHDDDAVSPVIGVILMVAITVILAAVIATFVLGLGEQIGNTGPTASFDFEFTEGSDEGNLTITHTNGDRIEAGSLYVRGADVDNTWASDIGEGDGYSEADMIGAGDSITVDLDDSGDTVRVIWEGDSGGQSNTLEVWEGSG